ncbi:granulins-like [Pitangus sulphuratus]|nr:granulins-like [Pitangus sulphuratus]
MLGQRGLLLVLLALLALAQQHSRGDQGTAPAFTAAPQGHWTPTAPPAPPKAESPGYCPHAGSAIGPSCGASCHNDTACHAGEKCCTRGCCTRCVHAEPGSHQASAKPGSCPMVLRGSLGPCLELCDTDSDCLGDDKCCTTGCGHICKPPTEGDPQKPGRCPRDFMRCLRQEPPLCANDSSCPAGLKCCPWECRLRCIPPAEEKPGICPLAEEALLATSPCGTTCIQDWQCPGAEKCCSSSRCGHVCLAPEPDKPGECPKVRPQQTSEPCKEEDSCAHDRDCPRQEKCCFSGCAMRCTRPARVEHPGECPRAQPCWDPWRRRRSQCLDDSVCRREEKCCDTGCGWECVAVPRESQDSADGKCVEECQVDSQCPRGQRCTSIGCGHVCMDIPGGESQPGPLGTMQDLSEVPQPGAP